MSLPRKGSRTVTHGEHRYRWRVRRKPTYSQGAFSTPMTVAIERVADEPGTVLLVNLGVSRPDNWLRPHQTALKPATVRQIIAAALEGGWKPDAAGGPHDFKWQLIVDRP
jgi:hypothetical protein